MLGGQEGESRSACGTFTLFGRCRNTRTVHKGHCTPLEALTGDTIDISEWIEFEFYDLVVYWDNRDGEAGQSIGRWLGPSHHIGSALCY